MEGIHLQGAEAKLKITKIIDRVAVIKQRLKKNYRNQKLDEKLRFERTKNEARILHKAKLAGVLCPIVFEVDDFDLYLEYIEGDRPENKDLEEVGSILAKLHIANIIHGDYTLANLIKNRDGKIYVIDFGLGYISNDIEDKATDVFTILRTLKNDDEKALFQKGYSLNENIDKVMNRVRQIEKRVRYAF